MKKNTLNEIIERLLKEIEEEEIGISLFMGQYQNEEELKFFPPLERDRVCKILRKLSEDSQHHKELIHHIVEALAERRDA